MSHHFMQTLIFLEGITTFLGTKEVLLMMSVQLQVKSKYDDYILVCAESGLAPAFQVSPGQLPAIPRQQQGTEVAPVSPLSLVTPMSH